LDVDDEQSVLWRVEVKLMSLITESG
jgi:hypothetical protein